MVRSHALADSLWICFYAGAFTVTYFGLRKYVFTKLSDDFNNRMTSLVHALVLLPLSAAVVDFRHPFVSFGKETTNAQAAVLCVTAGYYVYDTVACYYINHDMANTVHHLCSMAAVFDGLFNRRSGTELTCCLFLMELTNPFLHIRSYFKETGRGDTTMAEVNNAVFALSFFLCRIVAGPFVTYYTITCPTASPIVKLGGVGIQVLSAFWFYKMVQIALYKSRGGKGAKKKDRGGAQDPKSGRDVNGVEGSLKD